MVAQAVSTAAAEGSTAGSWAAARAPIAEAAASVVDSTDIAAATDIVGATGIAAATDMAAGIGVAWDSDSVLVSIRGTTIIRTRIMGIRHTRIMDIRTPITIHIPTPQVFSSTFAHNPLMRNRAQL